MLVASLIPLYSTHRTMLYCRGASKQFYTHEDCESSRVSSEYPTTVLIASSVLDPFFCYFAMTQIRQGSCCCLARNPIALVGFGSSEF